MYHVRQKVFPQFLANFFGNHLEFKAKFCPHLQSSDAHITVIISTQFILHGFKVISVTVTSCFNLGDYFLQHPVSQRVYVTDQPGPANSVQQHLPCTRQSPGQNLTHAFIVIFILHIYLLQKSYEQSVSK